MSRKSKTLQDVSFWGHVQATQVFPIGNPGKNRLAIHPRWHRAGRKTRPQGSLPLRFTEAVSRAAAWNRAAMTASNGTTIF